MTLLYGRKVKVEVAGLVIQDLRVSFSIEREIDATKNRGSVTIYNLSRDNERRVDEKGSPIRIQAGYPDTVALIFDGYVEKVTRTRTNLSSRTTVELTDSVRRKAVLGGVTSATFNGPVSVRDLVAYLVRSMALSRDPTPAGIQAPLPLGPLDAIPESATYPYFSYSGPTTAALTGVLKRVGCTWFEDDGIIRINKPKAATGGAEVQSDAPTIHVSPETGLLGRATDTDEGAEILMLLNPAVVLGCRIELRSKALQGSWKVVALRHVGDTFRGRFTTWCELRKI